MQVAPADHLKVLLILVQCTGLLYRELHKRTISSENSLMTVLAYLWNQSRLFFVRAIRSHKKNQESYEELSLKE
jgi:hypothetical protein